jgi:DNA topoisomerase VI subunit B
MSIAEALLPEFDQEMATTRRLLERVPTEKGKWKPHPKSFSLGHLTQLVSGMPGWITNAVTQTELNLVHHRGQLTVYLRLIDVPVPSIYGPTADEPMPGLSPA